jgi:P4 family phage/plasmid primase-like protien
LSEFLPEKLYERGYRDLVSVIPPGATLAPSSKIAAASLGKAPGIKRASGLWTGYDWRQHVPSVEDVRQWARDGANVGLRADHFPAVDVDSLEPGLAKIVEDVALAHLGKAPIRFGRRPKRLLMYRTDTPFTRMRLTIEKDDVKHLIEVLGAGQQYLIHGVHPKTMMPYEWDQELPDPALLTPITVEQVQAFFQQLASLIDLMDLGKVTREGTGRPATRAATPEQTALLAPSIADLRSAVSRIPNTSAAYPDRESYIKFGYAIKAACGVEEHEGFEIFASWAARWEGDASNPNGNDPDTVHADWRRMAPPYVIGWPYIAETARAYGFNAASLEFGADAETPERREEIEAVWGSDQWLADQVVNRRAAELRFVPMRGIWLVWDGTRWVPDSALMAEDIIKQELRRIGDKVARMGSNPKEQAKNAATAKEICSAYRVSAVRQLIQSDRAIALTPDVLDHDPWVLCTPGGLVDLKTGSMLPADPDKLCTRITAVSPDFHTEPKEWLRFLKEATGNDAGLQGYLQRLAGYALTGSTREQQFTFIFGQGGNGKGTFLHAIEEILKDYCTQAAMETFTASASERHTTEVAMLAGARLVTASETEAGKQWNEQRLTSLTGGDRITARFMRQDNFVFLPQFKLVFAGNHKPQIQNVTDALKRRTHLVPFTHKPAVVDLDLDQKLRAEYPAILAWALRGCLAWQEEGLNPPASVRDTTSEYFHDEDTIGQWIAECTVPEGETTTADLFDSWSVFAHRNKYKVGNVKVLASALSARGLERWRHSETRRMGFKGIAVKTTTELPAVAA